MAEEEGFEPPRALTPLPVFKTDPFSRAWVFLRKTINNITRLENDVNSLFEKDFIKAFLFGEIILFHSHLPTYD